MWSGDVMRPHHITSPHHAPEKKYIRYVWSAGLGEESGGQQPQKRKKNQEIEWTKLTENSAMMNHSSVKY